MPRSRAGQTWRSGQAALGRGARRLAWPVGAPPRVTAWPQYLTRYWGALAGMCLAGQVLTGLALSFYYPGPDPAQTQAGLAAAQASSWLAWGLRRLHAAGASLLLLALLAHGLGRVWSGQAEPVRRGAWLTGLGLLLASLASFQSGVLLPATQGAWASLAGLAQALGLPAPNLAGLGAAWSLHLALPWLLAGLALPHLRLVWPAGQDGADRETDPHRAQADAAIVTTGWLLTWLALGWLASGWFLDQPLPAPDEGLAPSRPVWFLLAPAVLSRWLPGGWLWLPLLAAAGVTMLLRRGAPARAAGPRRWTRLGLGLWLALTLTGLAVAW